MSLRVIWQYMDRSVTKKILYGPSSFGPYNIFGVTNRSIYCHMTLSAMNYLLYTATCSINVYTLATNCTWRCWSQANPFWDSKPELFSDCFMSTFEYSSGRLARHWGAGVIHAGSRRGYLKKNSRIELCMVDKGFGGR